MKKIAYILITVLLSGAIYTSCTDDFEEINTNPHKVYDVDVNDFFAGTVSRTMKLYAELNYNRMLNFSRYAVVQFNTNPGQDTGDSYFRQFNVDILRDLVKLERSYSIDPTGYENRLAIVKIWKSYVYYMMASVFGPVPMSDAITDGSENKRVYKYDTELEIYTAILNDLKDAVALIDPATIYANDRLVADIVFGGDDYTKSDLNKWKKFANTLRLNVAMHMQNLDAAVSQEHALAVMEDESSLISSLDDMVKLRWGMDTDKSASYYYERFIKNQSSFQSSLYPAISEYFFLYMASYNDPRLSAYCKKSNEGAPTNEKAFLYTDTLTRPHLCYAKAKNGEYDICPHYEEHQADGLNKYRRDSILVEYSMPYVPMAELNSKPAGWDWELVPGETYTYSDPLDQKKSNYNYSFVQPDFVKESATMVLLNWADACFLKAEAALLYKNDEVLAKRYYEEGIRASFAQYNKLAEVDAYLATDGVKWGTSGTGYNERRMLYRADINGGNGIEGKLEQLYKQRFFADFFNGLEGWNLERRTRVLRYPPFFSANASSNVEGTQSTYNYWTERIIYPEQEMSKNKEGYLEGIQKLRAASPYTEDWRWGDNVFTSLGFSKLNPDLETAREKYAIGRRMISNCDYFNKKYGSTYEEVLATAKEMTGERVDSKALTKAFNYAYKRTLSKGGYPTEDMPEPEPEPEPEVEPVP